MKLSEVRTWLDQVARLTPAVDHLSRPGARLALDAALNSLSPIEAYLDRPAPDHTVFVAARTVYTAPLEWLAVLLGRGGRVTVKSPEALVPWFQQLVSCTTLPLSVTTDRSVIHEADLVIAMGSDRTVAALRDEVRARFLGFGSRYSAAWWTDPAQVDQLVDDLVLHDGRGCMSPVAIFSPLPDAAERLHEALMACPIPRGPLAPIEAATLRGRSALAKVVGQAYLGTDHAVLQLPIDRLQLDGLPRVAVVHPCPDASAFLAALKDPRISVLGTDEALETPYPTRPLGRMQRPPLDRLHDGIDWLTAIEAE